MQNRKEIFTYLSQEPLRNIVLLKMLTAHEASIQAVYITVEEAAGVLMLLPTDQFTYDVQTYPSAKYVVLISADNTAVTEAMLSYIPRDGDLIFKLFTEDDLDIIQQSFDLHRQRGFISFTTDPNQTFPNHPSVTIFPELDEQLLPMYHQNGYTTEEVEQWFAARRAIGFAIFQQSQPISVGMVFQNYADIWEIGGLHTIASARRQGNAQKIVETAVHTLQKQNRVPRYQCHEANVASRYLAEKVGLDLFLHTEHYLYTQQQSS